MTFNIGDPSEEYALDTDTKVTNVDTADGCKFLAHYGWWDGTAYSDYIDLLPNGVVNSCNGSGVTY